MREMVGGCCVCSDDRGWPENPLVYCDGQSCTVAVHQACYGIVTVPTGPWYCRKCESQERAVKVKCELCPSKHGALKRTDNNGWAHVVCALYIPEVRFGNVTTMEPIQLQLIPAERFNKVCYICEEKGKPANASVGACMQCNKAGCKQQFHVTCAQSLGLLCEEAGNYLDNVKYCGYCQHHYSKLKKGGNVKTIPPYKPVNNDNQLSDSNSEKEGENASPSKPTAPTTTSTKRKSSSNSKPSSSTKSTSNIRSSSSSNQKSPHGSGSKNSDKSKTSASVTRSAKSEETAQTDSVENKTDKKDIKSDPVETEQSKIETRETKGSKKRKNNNSRTPTPNSVTSDSVSSSVPISGTDSIVASTVSADKKELTADNEPVEKFSKRVRVDTTHSILANQPIVALTSLPTLKAAPVVSDSGSFSVPISSALPAPAIVQPPHPQVNSLVVSVPLSSTSLSPRPQLIQNQVNVVTPVVVPVIQDISNSSGSADTNIADNTTGLIIGGNSNQNSMISSEISNSGGLKITYEKQQDSTMEVDMELEVPIQPELPSRRSRSQSNDKVEKGTRGGKKRNSNANGVNPQVNVAATSTTTKRASRSQHSSPPPPPPLQLHPGAFASISQIKESPPSSPSSESQGATTSRARGKTRKSAPAAVSAGSSKDNKTDVKVFQNGLNAPHMMGNQLNPNSNMAQKMSDHLNSELEAHSIFNANENISHIGPQLHHKVIASARASSTGGSSTASGGSGFSSMLGGGGGNIPQTLDQLLERQWEQGSQFLMEQAQHFDIASLLSCLHQLRAENLRLEEHVSSLIQRRDHLLAVNARLAIPLTGQPVTPQSSHAHAVNNVHPAVAGTHADIPRSRHSSGSSYPPSHQQGASHSMMENGLPPEQAYPPSTHRSPVASQPPRSPTVRHSPAGSAYASSSLTSSLVRQNADTSGRSAPRPQPYPVYQGPGPSTQPQVVIRRELDEHQPSSKPS